VESGHVTFIESAAAAAPILPQPPIELDSEFEDEVPMPVAAEQPAAPEPARLPLLVGGRPLTFGDLPAVGGNEDQDQPAVQLAESFSDDDVPALISAFAFSASTATAPSRFLEALASPEASLWRDAMDEEWRSLTSLDAYEFVPQHDASNVIPGRWVYTLKHKADGSIAKYKARFVAQGFMQRRDGMDVYSPVPSMSLIRAALAVGAHEKMIIEQLDVKTAFLQARLPRGENIYVHAPEGYGRLDSRGEAMVLRLKSYLYGLRQAPKEWNGTFAAYLRKCGLKPVPADSCIWVSVSGIILIAYVDDIIIMGRAASDVADLRNQLVHRFSISLLGELSWFLGIKITYDRSKGVLQLDQSHFVQELLLKNGMAQCNPSLTPATTDFTARLEQQELAPLSDKEHERYRSIVGSFLYLSSVSLPEIAYTVGQLARYMAPGRAAQPHMDAVHQLLRYVRGRFMLPPSQRCLTYTSSEEIELKGYVDASWGSCTITRRSACGFVFYVTAKSSPVMWKAYLQPVVALSSCGSEYMALSDSSREVIPLRSFLSSLSFPQLSPTVLFEDNTGAIKIAEGAGQPQRTRHIDIRFHFVKEQIERGIIRLEYIPTADQIADGFTKALDRFKYAKFVRALLQLPA
jgi:hypothetical protein